MKQAWRFILGSITVLLVLMVAPACKHTQEAGLNQPSLPQASVYNPYEVKLDPLFEVASVSISKHPDPNDLKVSGIPRSNIYFEDSKNPKTNSNNDLPHPKVSPVLQKWLREMNADDVVEIMIGFKEDLRIPLLPELAAGEKRDDPNSKRAMAINVLERKRNASQKILLDKLEHYGQFERISGYWIVNCSLLSVQIGEIEKLAQADFVTYLQPKRGGESPPADFITGNDVEDGREQISSDPYFDLGLTHPWIGILDTGVRDTHELLSSHIDWARDCVNGGIKCNDITQPGYSTNDNFNHGTSTAAIISGSPGYLLGSEYRGVSEVRTDSWKIYYAIGCSNPSGCLDSNAAVRGIEAGVAAYDRVLVGEIQANESETGCIARAADNAYDSGVVFVAANGNSGPFPEVVDSPGLAHKVIGVGAFDILSGQLDPDQSWGPSPDGRIKPDIQAPTNSETASNASDTALHIFDRTSGATPYAASAALLSRNWLGRYGYFDNGQTYAFMILYGQNYWPHDNIEGAGPLIMATNGWAWWGKVVLEHDLTIDIPINVMAGKQNFDLALWWPESAEQDHNNIDVYLIDPTGIPRAHSTSVTSIFERTGVQGSLTPGSWTVSIHGEEVQTQSQIVYWAVTVRN